MRRSIAFAFLVWSLPAFGQPLSRCAPEKTPSEGLAFDHFGQALNTGPEGGLVEGESVKVTIYAPEEYSSRLRVQRITEPRTEGYRILGIKDPEFQLALANPPEDNDDCKALVFQARDLIGGHTSYQIAYLKDEKTGFMELGKFTVPAAREYAGVASFGVVASFLEDRTFTLVPEAPSDSSANVVSIEKEDLRFRYLLGLAPFFAHRPVRPGRFDCLQLVPSPFVGFDLERPFDNLYAGISVSVVDVVYIIGGAHFGRVTRLPEGLSLAPGDAYVGSSIPTVERLEVRPFVGITADARIAISALAGLFKGISS